MQIIKKVKINHISDKKLLIQKTRKNKYTFYK